MVVSLQEKADRISALLDRGQVALGLHASRDLVDEEPQSAVACQLYGLCLKQAGEPIQAEHWLRRSIDLEPDRAEFHANLGNLFRQMLRFDEACLAYQAALRISPGFRSAARSLALTLQDLGRNSESESHCRAMIADDPSDAQSWVLLGMALAAQDRNELAEDAYREAMRLDPANRIAHHNLGALLSGAGRPEAALPLLNKAAALGADGFELAFNRARTLLELNEVAAAEGEFERAVGFDPTNIEAQLNLARVRHVLGDPKFARALASAAERERGNPKLQLLLAEVSWRSGNLLAAEALVHDLIRRLGPEAGFNSMLARILLEQDRLVEAESHALDAVAAAPGDSQATEILVNILLARLRPKDALPFIASQRRIQPLSQAWLAYQAVASRLLDGRDYRMLYDFDRLVMPFDLPVPPGWSSLGEFNQAVLDVLRSRHPFSAHPLDQTLRNGTQTARNLVHDPDPVIQALIESFRVCVDQYRSILGEDESHPLSVRNRGKSRFTGAWSVRLRQQGYHVNHIHPDGWLSSAYYVQTPPEVDDVSTRAGWLKFGEFCLPVEGLGAERYVQPRPGRLVLFPSYMWHGTTPIQGNETRITVAFDVVPADATG